MELIIYNPQEGDFLQQIDWNFEDLKGEISKKSQEYMNLVYSDSQIKEAKKDRATLRKLITALEDKRKQIKEDPPASLPRPPPGRRISRRSSPA